MFAATDVYPSPYSGHYRSPVASGASTPFLLTNNWDLEIKLQLESQKTKTILSRVSRAWRELSAVVLFNSIVLHDSRQVPRLSYAFDGDKIRRGGVEGAGSWACLVRRLWVVNYDDFRFWVRMGDGLPDFSVIDLIQRCPNMVSFRNFGRFTNNLYKWPDTVQTQQAVCRSIMKGRCLETDPETPSVPFGDLREVELELMKIPMSYMVEKPESLYSFDYIQVLKLECKSPVSDLDETLLTNAEFPVLEYIHLSGVRAFTQALLFNMPALRHLSFDPHSISPFRITPESETSLQVAIRFLTRHGQHLEELSLTSTFHYEVPLEKLCPNLIIINAVVLDPNPTQLVLPSHSNVRRLGITRLEVLADPWSLISDGTFKGRTPEDFFGPLFQSYPNLRTVQDLGWDERKVIEGAKTCWSRSVPGMEGGVFLDRTLELFRERRVKLLDWRGMPLSFTRRH